MSTVKERLKEFIKYEGLTVKAFEASIGAGNAYVNSIVNSIGAKYLPIILEKYPHVNREWLLFGEGEMLREPDANAVRIGTPMPVISEEMIPVRYYEVTPTATFQEFCSSTSEMPSTIAILPEADEALDDTYCVFEVHGESMAPQLHTHTRILCREISPTRWHRLRDCVVAIAFADKFVIKRLAHNDLAASNTLILASDNPEFPGTVTVQLSDIRAIFVAKRIISSAIR